jgi:hypothetical protein
MPGRNHLSSDIFVVKDILSLLTGHTLASKQLAANIAHVTIARNLD